MAVLFQFNFFCLQFLITIFYEIAFFVVFAQKLTSIKSLHTTHRFKTQYNIGVLAIEHRVENRNSNIAF